MESDWQCPQPANYINLDRIMKRMFRCTTTSTPLKSESLEISLPGSNSITTTLISLSKSSVLQAANIVNFPNLEFGRIQVVMYALSDNGLVPLFNVTISTPSNT